MPLMESAVLTYTDTHDESVHSGRKEYRMRTDQKSEEKYAKTLMKFDQCRQRAIQRTKGNKLSLWLTVLLVEKNHLDSAAQEFRDGLLLQYKRPLLHVPLNCAGCHSPLVWRCT